ncbi:MAG: HlyD family efflux transporter periplasmic adaptor subunit [Planctomycetota bacterium]
MTQDLHESDPQPADTRAGARHGKRRWLAGAAVSLLMAGGGVGAWAWASNGAGDAGASVDADPAAAGDWFVIEPRSFDLEVRAPGELDAASRQEVRSRVGSARPIIDWVIEEGATVKQGDKLFELNAGEVEQEVQEAQIDFNEAEADVTAAQQDLEIAESESKATIRDAEVALELARLEMEEWRDGTEPIQRRELELELKKSERDLDRAKRDYENSQKLYDEDFISYNELEDARFDWVAAQDALATANLALGVYKASTYKKELETNRNAVEQAEGELERAKEKAKQELDQLRAQLQSQRELRDLRKSRLDERQAELVACVVYAPQPGTVIYASSVGPWWRRRDPIAPGRAVRENETVIILPNTDQMAAVLSVHEARIASIQAEQEVSVQIDARPGEPVRGMVSVISKTAEDSRNSGAREYKVTVMLPPGFDPSLKPGMSCQGRVKIGRVENLLAAPIQAVFTEGQRHFVYTGAGGDKVRAVDVTLGQAGESFVVIESGLEPGDRVLLREPTPDELTG